MRIEKNDSGGVTVWLNEEPGSKSKRLIINPAEDEESIVIFSARGVIVLRPRADNSIKIQVEL